MVFYHTSSNYEYFNISYKKHQIVDRRIITNKELTIIGDKCTGCELCSSVCPVDAISFVTDGEGFRYPSINASKCIDCNKCVKNCPNNTYSKKNKCDYLDAYAGYSLDNSVVKESSSGGAFYTIAKDFISNGEKVAAVVWSSQYKGTEHRIIKCMEDLPLLQKSKYIQSKKAEIYKEVAEALKESKVLFVGCPCEIAAIKIFCPDELQERLYTIDFVCQGPTSEKAMVEYVDFIRNKFKLDINEINMRYKIGRWIPQYLRIEFENGKEFIDRLYNTEIGDAIRVLQRPSCYSCEFTYDNRFSDLTMGDYHGAMDNASYYNESGISILVANTDKGRELINILKKNDFYLENADYKELAVKNPRMTGTWSRHKDRAVFSDVLAKEGLIKAAKSIRSTKEGIIRIIPIYIRLYLKKVFKLRY